VARGTQHRKRRPTANAAVAPSAKVKAKKPPKQDTWEDQLFFSRLRRHAKWVYVLLAVVFAAGFVLFGVGSGSTGMGDSLSNFFGDIFNRSASTSSVGGLQKKTREHPTDAKAWLDLAEAQEQKDDLDGAIVSLTRYTDLRPRDGDRLSELGGLYLRQADNYAQQYVTAQSQASSLKPSDTFEPSSGSPLAQALDDPIDAAVSTSTSTDTTDAYTKYTDTQAKAVVVYKKLVGLNPKDATNQYRLAQVAQAANNKAEAIAAYTAFLKLAPNDSLAPAAKKALTQLKKETTAPAASASTSG
jgi:cytochrome c-type biogenesis protein CcmH/NrfG